MKVIVSHDIDHLHVSEHFTDLIIPKFIVRSKIEFLMGRISFSELSFRLCELFENKWNRIDELMEFNLSKSIPSTFFVGVNNGLGLNYSLEKATSVINKIQSKGFDIGVHGIAYDDYDSIKQEFDVFSSIVGHKKFGIRMHYLRNNQNTMEYLMRAGYLFDASLLEFNPTYKINSISEFPVHIMDTLMINKNKSWQVNNWQQALDDSKRLIDSALISNFDYFSILFHDRYFSDGFVTWKKWYIKLVEYLIQNDFKFVNYKMALREKGLPYE